jgi:hypothetical protein
VIGPKPRNQERIQRELFPEAAATTTTTTASGDENNTNRHNFCRVSQAFHATMMVGRRCTTRPPVAMITLLTPFRPGQARNFFNGNNDWFPPGVDEFHAKTLHGETALNLAAANDDSTRESLLRLQVGRGCIKIC